MSAPKPLTEMIVARLRPSLSAWWPNIRAPIGRPISVAAKMAPVISDVCASESSGETKYLIAGASTITGK